MIENNKSKIYPLFGIVLTVFIMIFGLISAAKDVKVCALFVSGIYLIFLITGLYKACLKVIFPSLAVSIIFGLITYFSNRDVENAISIGIRFIALGVAIIPGMSIRPIDLTRNLNQFKVPRGITLGMLIALNFTPLLSAEIKQIREAMKTRGAGNVLNFKIFYRAFLIPLIMRLVNISDTLSLSVETRGFVLDNSDVSIYCRVVPKARDFIIFALIVMLTVGVVII